MDFATGYMGSLEPSQGMGPRLAAGLVSVECRETDNIGQHTHVAIITPWETNITLENHGKSLLFHG